MSTVAPEHVSSDPPAEVEPVTNEELALISLPEGDTPAESGEETAGVTPSGSSAATKKLPPKPPKKGSKKDIKIAPAPPPSKVVETRKDSTVVPIQGGSSIIEDGDLDLPLHELKKLVPIFLEDAFDGNLEAVNRMLELDAKTKNYSIVQQTDDEGRTALHKAALEGQKEVLRALVNYVEKDEELQYLIDAKDDYGNSPFFHVCIKLNKSEDAQMGEFLLRKGAKVDVIKANTLMTPLHWACYHGSAELAQVIVKRQEGKKNVFVKNAGGLYPIDMAGEQYIKKLYEESDEDAGDSILPEYLKGSTSDVYGSLMKQLLAHGDDDQTLRAYQSKRLYWASVIDAHDHVESAIKRGAKVNALNKTCKNQTALHGAARHGSVRSLRILLDNNAAIDAKDTNCNTPLIECIRMSNYGGRFLTPNRDVAKILLENGANDMLVNRQNYRALQYARDPELTTTLSSTAAAKAFEDTIPRCSWDWVMVFEKGHEKNNTILEPQYKKVAERLRKEKLTVDVCGSFVNDSEVYVCVDAEEKVLQESAERYGYEVQLLSGREYRAYKRGQGLFAPFKTQERMEITMEIIKEAVDIEAYLAGGVMKRMFAVHDESELIPIRERWVEKFQPFASFSDYTSDKQTNSFEDLNHVRSYYGEKVAFYYAWFCHYTATLSYIVPISVAISVYQIASGVTTSGYLAFYSIILVIWSTYHGETWKRKQEELAFRWDMLDFEQEEKTRPEFRGDENINKRNGFVEKHYPEEIRRRKQWFSVPMLITFAGGIVGGFVAVQMWRQFILDTTQGNTQTIMILVATTVNTAQIVILDMIWGKLALKLTDWENHRTDTEWEDSYIFKKFLFMLVNNTMAAFYVAFVERNMQKLYISMFSLIIGKQLTNVVKDVSIPIAKTLPRRRKLKKKAETIGDDPKYKWEWTIPGKPDLTKKDVIEARLEVAENDVMDDWGGTVNEYSELMIQYAFVVLFSLSFPLAPTVAWFFNIIGIRGEMVVNTSVVQRAPTLSARDIGSWQTIQEGLGVAAIVVNVALLLFTMEGELGAFYKSWFPTYSASLWALISLEHILLFVKLVAAGIIEDKPAWVVEEEQLYQFRQKMLAEQATRQSALKESAAVTSFARAAPKAAMPPKWGKLKKMMALAMEKAKQAK
jgi:ankyrin repeat protein